MATNSEKLDALTETIHEMKTDIVVIKNAQTEQTKILKGNGVMGLVDKVSCQDVKLNQLDNTVQCILEEKKKENEKKENKKDHWYWLVIEKLAVPVVMTIITAVITAYVIAPMIGR